MAKRPMAFRIPAHQVVRPLSTNTGTIRLNRADVIACFSGEKPEVSQGRKRGMILTAKAAISKRSVMTQHAVIARSRLPASWPFCSLTRRKVGTKAELIDSAMTIVPNATNA
ncbi:hypothetical protein D3C72_1743030 [compost metagenome]